MRIREYGAHYSPDSVYFTDLKRIGELRSTHGDITRGTAYITAPEAAGKVAGIRWPPGEISIIILPGAQSMEGFILAARKSEEETLGVPGTKPP